MNKHLTNGTHHIGLTVNKLEESASFFTKILGWEEVLRMDDYPAIFVKDSKLMVTLWKAQTTNYTVFDRKKNIGLHHLALLIEDKEGLEKMHKKLKEHNIEIEFTPTFVGDGPAMHMMCYDPSGIRIEFIWAG